jgi:hypothetical protein
MRGSSLLLYILNVIFHFRIDESHLPVEERKHKRTDYISWDDYFMAVACLSAQRSKDPSTQVGIIHLYMFCEFRLVRVLLMNSTRSSVLVIMACQWDVLMTNCHGRNMLILCWTQSIRMVCRVVIFF